MLGERDISLVPEPVDRIVEGLRPRSRVPYLCAPDWIDVVQCMSRILSQVQRSELGIEHHHLGWRFHLRRELKDDLEAVNAVSFKGLCDASGRCNQRSSATRHAFPEPRIYLSGWAFRQRATQLEERAPHHRCAGKH